MTKYRIVERRALYRAEFGWYYARNCWDVEKRILLFFWVTVKGFWDKEMAESYYNALLEISDEQESNS